jgi:putative nucleotidyltransferase with HDIG domain
MGEQKTSKGFVLIVDDEPSIPKILCERLSREGFDCHGCSSGEEAQALLQDKNFDMIISDLVMPGISGMELLEEVHAKFPRTAFLMVTGMNDVRTAVLAMKKGGADYLVKPFTLDALVASVERGLEKKGLEREVENYRLNLEQMVEQRTKQLQVTYDETLEVLGLALELKDDEGGGHSRRVTDYCHEIARAFGLSPEQLKQIARGAYLHDIGKIGIPDAILLKPGKLTPEERVVMESHTRIGYELVSRVAFLKGAAEIVLAHHEWFDGCGYPQGLAEEEIPLSARIFAVADALDAITSSRPYRRALTFTEARAEIARESGCRFDPKVVEKFLSIPEAVWENIRQGVP